MKPTGDRRLWFARSVVCLLGVLALSLPAQAIADGVVPGGVGDIVDEVTQNAGDVVEPVTEGAGDVIDDVTQNQNAGDVVEPVTEGAGDVIDDVAEGADEVVNAVDEVTEDASDVVEAVGDVVEGVSGSVDGVTEGAGSAVGGVADSPGEAVGSTPMAPSDGHGGRGGTEPGPPTSGPGGDRIGSVVHGGGAHLMRREVDRPYFRWDFPGDVLGLWVPSAQIVESDTGPGDGDPCNDDVRLVCLGLLYGLGDFADTHTQVLSFLATTGIGVIALMILALGLGIGGSMALMGSRFRSAATAGRAG